MTLVADTSGLMGLASAHCSRQIAIPVLDIYVTGFELALPEQVVGELETLASAAADRATRTAAQTVLAQDDAYTVHSVSLDPAFPLDMGENAVVQLASALDAEYVHCDEYTNISVLHALLTGAQLITTPQVLRVFVRTGTIERSTARAVLEVIRDERSWAGNPYYERAKRWFYDEEPTSQ